MKENNKNQAVNVQLPPQWCSAICRNAMSEICIESCAITRDMTGFDPKPNLSLLDMSRFPITGPSNMTKEERYTIVSIYLSKIVDYLQGVENENQHIIAGRSDFDHSRSSHISKVIEIKDLLSGIHETNTSSEVRSQREDQAIRPSEVVESTD
ncbi:MAG TPA: hypothetical protein PLX90_02525 [Anaerolineales bacterium]|nr:hypothetical protein [Anaerolineales bacterium]